MATLNLKIFYPWYTHDVIVEVSDEIAEVLIADKRYESAYQRRMFYNKAHYSLDAEDGIEASAIACHANDPAVIFSRMENHCRLCQALNSLPEIQGRRIEAYFLLGMSRKEIAKSENVCESSVTKSINRGLREMKKIMSKNNSEICVLKHQ